MKFFRYPLILFLFISCSLIEEGEEEEFDYYEPIIGEEFQTVSDLTYKVEFEYQPQKDLIVETEDGNGIKYSIEFPTFALEPSFSGPFNGYIVPLTGIQNLPAGVDFQFGLEIEPYGIRFVKPVKITIDLPVNFNTQNLLGFYNMGYGGGAYLEPLKIKKSSSSTQAIFEVLHFSSYGGIKATDIEFDCPDPRSAQSCENLREIVACTLGSYEVGINEELNQQDQEAVNYILKSWMEEQLKYTDGQSMDYSDLFEFEYELSQYQCWKAMTQEFNDFPESEFGTLYSRAEEYIIEVIADIMEEANSLCTNDLTDDECLIGSARDLTKSYIQWLAVAQEIGIDGDPRIIDLFEFCDGSVNKVFDDFTMIREESLLEFDLIEGSDQNSSYKSYLIELGNSSDIIHILYLMSNLLGEPVELDESEFEWVDVTQWGGMQKGNFVYNNGALSMSADLQTLIGLCLPDDQNCDSFSGEFEVYRNDCYIATVLVSWSRY